jgi:hypothetical protein
LPIATRRFEGVAGVVADGIVEGYFGYEAGQPAVGRSGSGGTRNHVTGPGQDGAAVFENART